MHFIKKDYYQHLFYKKIKNNFILNIKYEENLFVLETIEI